METRVREALEADTERWENHLTWLMAHPEEDAREAQIAETEAIIAENRRLLDAA